MLIFLQHKIPLKTCEPWIKEWQNLALMVVGALCFVFSVLCYTLSHVFHNVTYTLH